MIKYTINRKEDTLTIANGRCKGYSIILLPHPYYAVGTVLDEDDNIVLVIPANIHGQADGWQAVANLCYFSVGLWLDAFEQGKHTGRGEIQRKMRQALGIK